MNDLFVQAVQQINQLLVRMLQRIADLDGIGTGGGQANLLRFGCNQSDGCCANDPSECTIISR